MTDEQFNEWVENIKKMGGQFEFASSGFQEDYFNRFHQNGFYQGQRKSKDCPYTEFELIRLVSRIKREFGNVTDREAIGVLVENHIEKQKRPVLRAIPVQQTAHCTQFYIPIT